MPWWRADPACDSGSLFARLQPDQISFGLCGRNNLQSLPSPYPRLQQYWNGFHCDPTPSVPVRLRMPFELRTSLYAEGPAASHILPHHASGCFIMLPTLKRKLHRSHGQPKRFPCHLVMPTRHKWVQAARPAIEYRTTTQAVSQPTEHQRLCNLTNSIHHWESIERWYVWQPWQAIYQTNRRWTAQYYLRWIFA